MGIQLMTAVYAAFFDLDHTILSGSTGHLYVSFALKKKYIKKSDLYYSIYTRLLHRLKFIKNEDTIQRWVIKFKGWPYQEFEGSSQEFFLDYIKPLIRPRISNEIEHHKSSGGITLILSASLSFICRPVQQYLGMDDCLCTELEIRTGKLTGNLEGRYCYGKEKLRRVAQYCASNGLSLDTAYYYADSPADLPVLEKVKYPVCVAPKHKLRRTARIRQWNIIY